MGQPRGIKVGLGAFQHDADRLTWAVLFPTSRHCCC